MADLDDFFAKKDKKKSKVKSKFLTTEELVKNLEDTSKREVAAKPTTIATTTVTGTGTGTTTTTTTTLPTSAVTTIEPEIKSSIELPNPDEEWKEFEEEQRKDYSGLKIGQMKINENDDEVSQEDDDDYIESDNAENSSKYSEADPWKKVIPAEEVTQIIVVENEKKVYISPALRNAQGNFSGMKRNRAAPDITNADFFPTLGAARPEEQRKKKNEPLFEEVKHGSRVQRVQQQQVAAPVSVANRFQTLDEDDS